MPSRSFAAAALAFAALGLGEARAEPYTLFVYETPQSYALRADPEKAPAYWGAYAEVGKAMAEAGIMRGGAPLEPAAAGAAVGPGSDAGDAALVLGGWFLIDVPTLADAVAWAERLPAAQDGRVEIRKNAPGAAM